VTYKKYAVLGSNSFAGSAFIARALSQGCEVMGFNRSPESSPIFLPYRKQDSCVKYSFVQADINHDLSIIMNHLDQFQPEVVVDFAGQGMVAESWRNPEQWYSTNIVSKVKLHEQLRHRKWLRRYIRVSTPEVYGSHDELKKESWIYNPSTPYAVSHAAVDMSLRAFHQQYDFPVIFTRFANFYGPGQQLYRIIPRTIIYALTGKKLQLQGGGSSIRAFIYGDDIADAIISSASKGAIGEAYHFSSENFYTIRQVVELICGHLGVAFDSLVEVVPDRPGKDQAYLMDSSKSRKDLGWEDKVSLSQGIDATAKWVQDSLKEICSLPLDYIHKI
jgi:dTDP-glucose 4,6-dehydratase